MKHVFWGSLLFGIGIGLVIASLASLLMMPRSSSGNIALSDEQIREKAKALGMIDPSEGNYKQNIKLKEEVPIISENKRSSDDKRLVLAITKGVAVSDVAEILKNTGVISDPQAFIAEVRKAGLTAKLQPGVFEIKQNSTTEDVIRLLFDTR